MGLTSPRVPIIDSSTLVPFVVLAVFEARWSKREWTTIGPSGRESQTANFDVPSIDEIATRAELGRLGTQSRSLVPGCCTATKSAHAPNEVKCP